MTVTEPPPTSLDSTPTSEDSLREEAIKSLKKKQDFHGHVLIYVMVNALLWGIWALTGSGFAWPLLVTLGWGVGIVMNVWDVYLRRPIGEVEVRREIERLRRG
jgi:2TM domain